MVVRGVREAQLDALTKVLGNFNAARRGHLDSKQEAFAGFLSKFLDRERAAAKKLRFDGTPDASEAEQKLRHSILDLLPKAADVALAARKGPAAAAIDRDQFRRLCEVAVLSELRLLVSEELPPLFESAFRGERARANGWFDLYFRLVAAEIKKGGPFSQIWQAEENAAIAYAVGATAAETAAIGHAVEALRAGVLENGTALAALAGEIQALGEQVAAMHARARDGGMVLDFEALVATDGVLRFAPRNPAVPFLGRSEEIEALERFRAAPENFAWWLLCGAGGAGKTRLALRSAMLAHAEGWRAGFLPKEFGADIGKLESWQPDRPTLIIVDYTLKRRDAVRLVADRLARRAADLGQKVRLLLIERAGGTGFDAQFLAEDSQGVIRPRRFADAALGGELALPRLSEDDLWELARGRAWHSDPTELLLPRVAFFDRLDRLDDTRRPLVAMILADAIANDAGRPVFDSLTDELTKLLDRDRRDLWPPVLGCANTPIGAVDADVAIAFATMLGGLGQMDVPALEEACGRELGFEANACASALGAGFDSREPHLPALEPDLIGEFFALRVLDCRVGFRGLRYPRLGEAAWRHKPEAMADFVRRAGQNFPHDAATQALQVPVPGIAASWRLRGITLLLKTGDLDAGIVAAADALRDPAAGDAAAAMALAEIAVAVTSWTDELTDPARRLSLLGDVARLMDAHSAEAALREQWAKSVTNYVYRRAAEEPAACASLLAALRALCDAHPAEAALREPWATSVTNYVYRRAAEEPAACASLLAALRALCDAHPAEAALREQWAKSVTNYVYRRAAEEPAACASLLPALRDMCDAHPAEAALREQWANSVSNYVNRRAGEEPAACASLLAALRALCDAHPAEAALREQWAKAVTNYVNGRAAEEPAACASLLAALRALCDAHPAEAALREQWANSVFNYVTRCAAEEPAACASLLAALRDVCDAHPAEAALREAWAGSVNNYVNRRAAEEPAACASLRDELHALCDAHPAEGALREQWAKSCAAYVVARARVAADETETLLNSMTAAVTEWPEEEPPLLWLAVGTILWTQANGARLPERAERLGVRLSDITAGRPAVLDAAWRLLGMEPPRR